MFRNTRYGAWNFQFVSVVLLFCFNVSFQFVSKRFETIESVDLEIFCLFQFVSVVLLYNLYVFETPDMGPVSKRFETIESVDLEFFCLFQFVQ